MQPVNTLRALFGHNDWARDKLLDAADPLSGQQLDRPFPMGKKTLRNTLEHLWRAEFYWLDRWQQPGRPPAERPEPGLPLDEVRRRFRATARERDDFLKRVGEAGESQRITFIDDGGGQQTYPLGDMMLHVCNHGFHHRAQALNMLRRVGATPPGLDLLTMKLEPSPQPPTSYDPETIAEYFLYNDWARGNIQAVVEGLSDAQLDQTFEMGLGSVRRTLLHIRDAEQWWFENWSGEPPESFQQLPKTTSVGELGSRLDEVSRKRQEFLSMQSGEDLQRTVRATPPGGHELTFTLGDTLLQLCGHGTQHRAQVVNMLRQLGVEAPGIDYIDWPVFRQVAAS